MEREEREERGLERYTRMTPPNKHSESSQRPLCFQAYWIFLCDSEKKSIEIITDSLTTSILLSTAFRHTSSVLLSNTLRRENCRK